MCEGNVDTRLEKLEKGEFDGLILAAAGMHRLGRAVEISFVLEFDEVIPAPAQGVVAIEARHSEDRPVTAAESITDRGALGRMSAERSLASALDATCKHPTRGGRNTRARRHDAVESVLWAPRRQRVASR